MTDARVHVLLERIANVLREDLRAVASAHGLKLAQLEALQFFVLANRHSDTLSGLVEFLGTTKGTASQTIHALERKGLVVRVRDPDDGRVQRCRPTEAGRALVEESLPAPALRGVPGGADVTGELEALLRGLLAARGGRSFGVCHTCAHYRARGDGAWCALLEEPLDAAESQRICREHSPAV